LLVVDALIFQQTQAITEHNRHLIVQNTKILISKLSRGSASGGEAGSSKAVCGTGMWGDALES
jgi:hypothetical protein